MSNFRIIQSLTHGCPNVHSIHPVNIFEIESKLYILQQNKDFQIL